MRRSLLVLTALAALPLASAPVSAGPPWIAIEYPANPHHPSTRGALLLVRAYHHSTAVAVPVRGTAEGLVQGRRTSRPLDLRATSTPGVFALRGELPREGTWVLAITAEQSSEASATAIVQLDGRGGIAGVEVPARESRDGWLVPRAVERSDIDRALRAAARSRSADAPGTEAAAAEAEILAAMPALAGWIGLPLLLVAVWRRRRR